VVDRVGNVLGHYGMGDVPSTVFITTGLTENGIETRLPSIPSNLAVISKALTGAYLSSGGNAFTTRTAGQIIQQHFDPDEAQQPSGPLYGVQYSQLSCSDVMRNTSHGDVGPKRAPLGLAADPGGLPLYKNGVLVGGIGVELDRFYRVDLVITDHDNDPEEMIAVAGTWGYAAPDDIRADRITADGRTFRYADSESLVSNPAQAPPLESLNAFVIDDAGYSTATVRSGTAFNTPASGIRLGTGGLASRGGYVLVDSANAERFPVRGSAVSSLTAAEVQAILEEGLTIANRARGQIRRPLGSSAQLTISVVDTAGDILGLVRTADAPVFGIDVAVQKARTAMFFSHPDAAAELWSVPPAQYEGNGSFSPIGEYVLRTRAFLGDPSAFTGTVAWTPRAIGNIHRPMFPDGIDGTPEGPLSKPLSDWSPFNVGLQLDLVNNQLVRSLVLGSVDTGCAGRIPLSADPSSPDPGLSKIRNGIQVFPGGVPIYRSGKLIGAVGVSGDGVDQDDIVAAFGSHGFEAPADMRADRVFVRDVRLPYVKFPRRPTTH